MNLDYVKIVSSKVDSKKFFETYSKAAGKIKKIEDLSDEKKLEAIKQLQIATKALSRISELVGGKK